MDTPWESGVGVHGKVGLGYPRFLPQVPKRHPQCLFAPAWICQKLDPISPAYIRFHIITTSLNLPGWCKAPYYTLLLNDDLRVNSNSLPAVLAMRLALGPLVEGLRPQRASAIDCRRLIAVVGTSMDNVLQIALNIGRSLLSVAQQLYAMWRGIMRY